MGSSRWRVDLGLWAVLFSQGRCSNDHKHLPVCLQERGGEGRRGGAPAVRCQAVRGGRELWVAMGDPECLWPSWDAWWAVSGGRRQRARVEVPAGVLLGGDVCPAPPPLVGKVLPIYVPGHSQPHLLPHRPQTLWSQTKDGGQHRAAPVARGCGQDGPISPSSLISSSPSSFQVVSPPTSAELKLSSYSCPVAGCTEASWQDSARAAPGLHTVCQGG